MNEFDYEKIRATALKGPRVTSLLKIFEDIAGGLIQAPMKRVYAAPEFLHFCSANEKYHDVFQRNMGTFYQHVVASIPFILEEFCRVGLALHKLAQLQSAKGNPLFTFYETSSADGTNARTLAEYSEGIIKTLTDSPNLSNGTEFQRLCRHNHSDIHIGPFVDITPEYLLGRNDRPYLMDGFDFIYEATTFQMYGTNRKKQIAYVLRVLKKDGVFFFLEKLNHPDNDEYIRREHIKDSLFKERYFTNTQLRQKKEKILQEMERGQVSLNELLDAIKYHFKSAYIIWNSGNFYGIAASNYVPNLDLFISLLDDPYVPTPFACETTMMRQLL